MAKYNFFISYSRRDGHVLARLLTRGLAERGYSVFWDEDTLGTGNLETAISKAIAECDCFLPIITDGFLNSTWCVQETMLAMKTSQERAKNIIPLIATHSPWPDSLAFTLAKYNGISFQTEYFSSVLDRIELFVGSDLKIAALYEHLSEYRELNHAPKESETLCQLIELLCSKREIETEARCRSISMDICRLLEQLSHYRGQYGAKAKKVGHRMLNTIDQVQKFLSSVTTEDNIFNYAWAVRLAYWDWDIRNTAYDLIYSGDVRRGRIDPYPLRKGIIVQTPHVQAFEKAFALEKDMLDSHSRFSAAEIDFIRQTPAFILRHDQSSTPVSRPSTPQTVSESPDEVLLLSVAKYLQESNKLFDELQKRGVAGDFLKCLLTSYERLKNYCQIVGATDVAADCVERIVDIRNQLSRQESKLCANEKAEDGIKSLLGLTIHRSGNYDVFISFKNEDADLAEKVYQLCQRHMKLPFWSKRTLPELSKSEYEDAIYDALRKSRHFVVVLSNLKYLEASWVQREMKAFDRAITEGRKPGGNFVFVVTDTVYQRIIDEKKMCLDERYCGYQILKMSEYEETLIHYIT